jgi:hypothetical protein
MNKRAEITHQRLNDLVAFRSRARNAILKKLVPGSRPVMAGDEDACERLQAEIDKAEALQKRMKEANASIRKHRKEGPEAQIAGLLALGFRLPIAQKLIEPDCCGRIGFADFELTNNGANIRRMKARIQHVATLKAMPTMEIEGVGVRIEDCPQDNRIRLFFPGKPDREIITRLKAHAFRWTPSMGCWHSYRNTRSVEFCREFLPKK